MHGLNRVVTQLDKTNKSNTLKSDALNALIMVSMSGPKCGISKVSYLIRQTSMLFGKGKKRYKKEPDVQEKAAFTETLVSRTQTEILHVESESQIDTEKHLDATITSSKYIVSNLMEMSDSSGTDSDDYS